MASCMIQAKSLDPSLEVEAISSATHILNRSPHLALDGKTPFEAWCGRKPNVTHLESLVVQHGKIDLPIDVRQNHLSLVLSLVMKIV